MSVEITKGKIHEHYDQPMAAVDVNPFGHFLSSSHTHRCPVMSLTDAGLRTHMEPQNFGF